MDRKVKDRLRKVKAHKPESSHFLARGTVGKTAAFRTHRPVQDKVNGGLTTGLRTAAHNMQKGMMQSLPILYSFRRCPYAMRARMAVLASGEAVEIREVVLRAKPQALLDASPKGTVPVLVLPDGGVIEQSLDIMLWALRRNDPEDWLGGQDAELIAINDGPFKHHLDRYKYAGRYDSDPLLHRAEGIALLARLNDRLAAAPFLCGADRALTDIAIFPFVRQFAATDQPWFDAQPLPRLQRWLAGHIASALFQRAMVRVPPWIEGQAAMPFVLRD